MVPINIRVSFFDRTNRKTYTSYFPSVYASDTVNRGVPQVIPNTTALSLSNTTRGASSYYRFNLNWPYSSSNSDISQKMTMKINGGVTCCTSFPSFSLYNTGTGTQTLLWTNKISNISVYRTGSISSGANIEIRLNSHVNPYPIQK